MLKVKIEIRHVLIVVGAVMMAAWALLGGATLAKAEISLPDILKRIPKRSATEFKFVEGVGSRGERIVVVTPTSGAHSHFRLVPLAKAEWRRLHPGEFLENCHYSDFVMTREFYCAIYREGR